MPESIRNISQFLSELCLSCATGYFVLFPNESQLSNCPSLCPKSVSKQSIIYNK